MAKPISPFVNELDALNAPTPTPFRSAVMAQMPQDAGAPPELAKISMGGPPPVFAAPPTPEVTRESTPIEQQIGETTQRLHKLQEKDATPFGSENNHPGVIGKILHGLATAGNIAGNILAPGTMAMIPGTGLNRQFEESSLGNRLQSLEQERVENEAKEAQGRESDALAGKTTAETAGLPEKTADAHRLSTATSGNLESETNARDNPRPKFSVHDTEAGPLFVNEQTGEAQHLNVDGSPVGPKLKLIQSQPIVGSDGKPHTYMLDDKGNKVVDLGVHYERPVTVNVGNERAARNDVLKAYQPTLDAAQRMNIMTDNYEKAVKDHDQQAMLSLLANRIGMTLGAQKGARITKDILHEAQESRPWLEGIKAKFDSDGVLSGVTLTPAQMRQMVGLGQSMYEESTKKSRATAQYLGADNDGPDRVPNQATIRYYMGLANGDATRAKEMASADGWTVK